MVLLPWREGLAVALEGGDLEAVGMLSVTGRKAIFRQQVLGSWAELICFFLNDNLTKLSCWT